MVYRSVILILFLLIVPIVQILQIVLIVQVNIQLLFPVDDGILSVVSSCTPRQSSYNVPSSPYSDKFYSPTPILNHLPPEETIKSSPTTQLCFNQHNSEYNEDLHRQRVLVSAHHRRQLNPRLRRSRSTPAGATRARSAVCDSDKHRKSWQATEAETEKLDLVVTNGHTVHDRDSTER